MRKSLTALTALALACATAAPASAQGPGAPGRDTEPAVVTTDNETPPLYDDEQGGAASGDDPAIWVHPTDTEQSLMLATAKEGGLRVYDMASTEVQSIAAAPAPGADGANAVDGRYNNVDIASGVELGGRTVDLAVVSDRYNDSLRFWTIDADGAAAANPLTEVTAPGQEFLFNPDRETVAEERTAYGLAVWQPRDGAAYAVITRADSTQIATSRIVADGGVGVGYTDVQTLEVPASFELPDGTAWTPCGEPGERPQLEGLGVDQRTGTLFAAQEDVGLWRIALPLGSGEPVLVDTVAGFGADATYNPETDECEPDDPGAPAYGDSALVADAEGVDVYYGPGRTGYVLVSSQGDDSFAVYATQGRNRSLGTFTVAGEGVDGIDGSDGLAVTNRAVGDYASGLLVVHDEPESGPGVDPERDPTGFSYVRWGGVADALGLKADTTPGNDPRH